ncbi:hypothetical protein [Streptomyces sp. NBC_00691]|uniref:hypothetical protein n=1 Tax=Streptomyces sp. NBC_00691 TaxID=2903671 RepID=UPI002E2F7BB3|nr:hypothetical protein [Streptomyces sp. NBC_00691]
MNRSRQAIRLAGHLTRTTAVHVELAHVSGALWALQWHDGPHREEMRTHLDAALAEGDRFAAMRDRRIGCSRFQSLPAWATLAAAARRGGGLASALAESAVHKGEEESDEANALWRYVRQLWETTSYPERVGDPEDVPLIEQLVSTSRRTHPSGRSFETSELYMAQALLARYGDAPSGGGDASALSDWPELSGRSILSGK